MPFLWLLHLLLHPLSLIKLNEIEVCSKPGGYKKELESAETRKEQLTFALSQMARTNTIVMWFLQIILNTFTVGVYVLLFFLATNYYFAKDSIVVSCKLNTHSDGETYFTLDNKEYKFYTSRDALISFDSEECMIRLRKGLYGFYTYYEPPIKITIKKKDSSN